MTVDLPDQLMSRMKIRAVHQHKKLKEVVEELIERGLREEPRGITNLPKLLQLKDGFMPTAEDVQRAIENGRDRPIASFDAP